MQNGAEALAQDDSRSCHRRATHPNMLDEVVAYCQSVLSLHWDMTDCKNVMDLRTFEHVTRMRCPQRFLASGIIGRVSSTMRTLRFDAGVQASQRWPSSSSCRGPECQSSCCMSLSSIIRMRCATVWARQETLLDQFILFSSAALLAKTVKDRHLDGRDALFRPVGTRQAPTSRPRDKSPRNPHRRDGPFLDGVASAIRQDPRWYRSTAVDSPSWSPANRLVPRAGTSSLLEASRGRFQGNLLERWDFVCARAQRVSGVWEELWGPSSHHNRCERAGARTHAHAHAHPRRRHWERVPALVALVQGPGITVWFSPSNFVPGSGRLQFISAHLINRTKSVKDHTALLFYSLRYCIFFFCDLYVLFCRAV